MADPTELERYKVKKPKAIPTHSKNDQILSEDSLTPRNLYQIPFTRIITGIWLIEANTPEEAIQKFLMGEYKSEHTNDDNYTYNLDNIEEVAKENI